MCNLALDLCAKLKLGLWQWFKVKLHHDRSRYRDRVVSPEMEGDNV